METSPLPQPTTAAADPAALPPPGVDMTGICFRDQLWLNTYPLDRHLVFDYFALSPFYDITCNNEQLRSQSIHPLDLSHLSRMTGNEYMLYEVMEPHLFVFRKQKRDGVEKVTPMLTYYILDGSVYQAPQLCNVFSARMGRALYHLSKAFTFASTKLEKIGHVDAEKEGTKIESKSTKELIDFKEVKRLDHILTSLHRKLPPAPAPPAFPEGYVPPPSEEKETDESTESQAPSDPILDQGPFKKISKIEDGHVGIT